MYWSSLGSEAFRSLLSATGFHLDVVTEETAFEFGSPVTFLWVVATKP